MNQSIEDDAGTEADDESVENPTNKKSKSKSNSKKKEKTQEEEPKKKKKKKMAKGVGEKDTCPLSSYNGGILHARIPLTLARSSKALSRTQT